MADPLFPGWNGKRALTGLRAFDAGRNWPRGAKLGTHSFRRGAARAILEAGGSFPQLLRSGQWRSSAYQLYLDLGHEEASAMALTTNERTGTDQEMQAFGLESKACSRFVWGFPFASFGAFFLF